MHKLPVKTQQDKDQTFTLNSKCLLHQSEKKNLGTIMAPELTCKLNTHKSTNCTKA